MSRMKQFLDTWGLPFYALFYPIILPPSFVIFPYWERFGLRWQVLVFSVLVACSSLLLDRCRSRFFCAWLSQSAFVWFAPLSIVWLLVMGVVHGFYGLNLQGILSGALVVFILPIYSFLLSRPLPQIAFRVLVLSVAVVLLMENIFAFGYRFLGLGMNSDHLWTGDVISRIFLNTRDGNFFAVFAACISMLLLWRGRNKVSFEGRSFRPWLVSSSLVFLVFLNQVLTSGRGVVVSLLFSMLVLRFVGGLSRRLWLQAILIFVCSFLAAYGFVFLFDLFLNDGSYSSQALIRSTSSRLVLWKAWMMSFFSSPTNFIFGHGFNHVPVDFLPAGNWPANPHNILVQFVADCGVLGCSVVGFCTYRFRSWIGLVVERSDPAFLFSLISLSVYLLISAALDWPTATWCLSLLPLALPAESLSVTNYFSAKQSSFYASLSRSFPLQLFILLMCFAAVSVPFLTMKQYLPFPLHLRPFLGEDALFWFLE